MPYHNGRWIGLHNPHVRVETSDYSHTCRCGKRSFTSRARAAAFKREVRRLPPQEGHAGRGHVSVYRCHQDRDVFHVGHLPQNVMDGKVGRRDVYG